MEERRRRIVELVNTMGNVSFAQLKERFSDVSEMTLRTDLKYLDETHQILRVYGGAKSVYSVIGSDDLLSRRQMRNLPQKQAIAKKAVVFLAENRSVFLDSGSTVTELVRCMPDMQMLIFASGVDYLPELAQLSKLEVHLFGGKMNRNSMCVGGPQTLKELSQLHFDLAILSTTSYNENAGFACGDADAAELKRAVLQCTDRVIMLMDSQKIGLSSTFSFAALDQIDVVVTDEQVPKEFRKACADKQIELY